jgi:hypothetical protein
MLLGVVPGTLQANARQKRITGSQINLRMENLLIRIHGTDHVRGDIQDETTWKAPLS